MKQQNLTKEEYLLKKEMLTELMINTDPLMDYYWEP